MLKLMDFSNPFGMAYVLEMNLPSSCIIIYES